MQTVASQLPGWLQLAGPALNVHFQPATQSLGLVAPVVRLPYLQGGLKQS